MKSDVVDGRAQDVWPRQRLLRLLSAMMSNEGLRSDRSVVLDTSTVGDAYVARFTYVKKFGEDAVVGVNIVLPVPVCRAGVKRMLKAMVASAKAAHEAVNATRSAQ